MHCQLFGRALDAGVVRDRRGASLVEYIVLVALIALVGLAGFRTFGRAAADGADRHANHVARLEPEASVAELPGANAEDRRRILPPVLRERFLPPPSTTSPSIAAATPQPTWSAPTRLAVARSLVRAGGSADSADAELVAAEVAKLPPEALDRLQAQGTRIVAARGSVTDYLTELRGVRPRGWPPGSSWDTVPGIFNRAHNEVVIAVIGSENGNPHVPRTGEGHGAYNLVIHECFHALDGARDVLSSSEAFEIARDADKRALPAYELQSGAAGYEEAFAESAAHYYGGDSRFAKSDPHLDEYWKDDPFD